MKSFQLSNAQKRLWLAQKLSGGHGQNTIRVVRILGELDTRVLEKSLRAIHRRHDLLRASFFEKDGTPYQILSEDVNVALDRVDLSPTPQSDRDSEIRRIVAASAYLEIDPSRCPLSSYTLTKLGTNDHLLAMVVHHLVNDGWSWGVFSRELEQLYRSGLRGEGAMLPPLRTRYEDHISREQAADAETTGSRLKYWESRLDGLTPVELPTNRILPKSNTCTGSQKSIVLDPVLSRRIRGHAAREKCTTFVIFLTALKILLSRCSGQEDIALGILTSGRRGHTDIQDLIGHFINILILRTELRGSVTFRDLLSKVNANLREDLLRSDLPFETLVESLKPDRQGDYNSLLHVLVNYRKSAWSNFNLQGLVVEAVDVLDQPARVPLQLNIEEKKDCIFVQSLYQSAIFSDARMAHFLSQYVFLLEQALDTPERGIRRFSLVTKESKSILPDPALALDCPRYTSVISRFMYIAERHGEVCAVVNRNRLCSYAELRHRVTTLSGLLKTQGFGDGKTVAVTGGRCIGLVAAIVAVMASGGIVLPIDPGLPRRRRQLCFKKANTSLVLALQGLPDVESDWLGHRGVAIWNIDPDTGQPDAVGPGSDHGFQLGEPQPDDPAYIFFTSGSTGEPSGVLGLHKGIDHFIDWQARQFRIGIGDRIAQLTHLSFDVLLRELFLPLATGGTLCIPSESERVNLLPWLDNERITVIHTVPTLANAWLQDVPSGGCDLRSLRWIFFSGESLSDSLVVRWRAAFPMSGSVVNLYGPTETTMIKSCYLVPPDPRPGNQPLGSPLPRTQLLVMNTETQLCGIGEPGEIVIRTPYGTAGYIDSLHVNEQKFRPNPYTKGPRDLLFYSGDKGRYKADGMIEIQGRMDQQFKVRGVRAEPGEIEQVLLQNRSVQACCISPCKDDEGQYRIVAYVVDADRMEPNVERLRKFAQERLPRPLVPSTFQPISEIPRLPNGKVDRQALPEPVWPDLERRYVAPRTGIEIQLAEIWANLLGISKIGINDGFLELGGQSLTAIRLVSRISDAFGIDLSLGCVFEARTLEEMARVIAEDVEPA